MQIITALFTAFPYVPQLRSTLRIKNITTWTKIIAWSHAKSTFLPTSLLPPVIFSVKQCYERENKFSCKAFTRCSIGLYHWIWCLSLFNWNPWMKPAQTFWKQFMSRAETHHNQCFLHTVKWFLLVPSPYLRRLPVSESAPVPRLWTTSLSVLHLTHIHSRATSISFKGFIHAYTS